MPQPFWVSPFDVKLVEPTDPIARDVLAIQEQRDGKLPLRSGCQRLGGVTIDAIYAYPLPAAIRG